MTINTAEIEARANSGFGDRRASEGSTWELDCFQDRRNLLAALKAETARAEKAEQQSAIFLAERDMANEKLAAARGHTEWLGEYLNGLLQDKAVKATFAREHATVLHAKVNAILDAFNTGDGNGR